MWIPLLDAAAPSAADLILNEDFLWFWIVVAVLLAVIAALVIRRLHKRKKQRKENRGASPDPIQEKETDQ